MTHLRLTWFKLGGHYHCQLRSATAENTTHALNGDLVFDEREWPDVLRAFQKIAEVQERNIDGTLLHRILYQPPGRL